MCVFLFTCPQVGGVHIVLAKGAENKKETPLALCALVPKLRLHLERGGLSDFFFFSPPLLLRSSCVGRSFAKCLSSGSNVPCPPPLV